jgi:pyrroloquinoline quinone biosynthesis protein D
MTDPISPNTAIDPAARPHLPPGTRLQTDRLTGRTVLLFPEGMLQLNPTGAAILELCDGHRSLDEVVRALSQKFSAAPEVLMGDVAEYLHKLQQRRLVAWDRPIPTAEVPPQEANRT